MPSSLLSACYRQVVLIALLPTINLKGPRLLPLINITAPVQQLPWLNLLLPFAASTQSVARSSRKYRVNISSGTLNLHSGPITSSQVIGSLVDGAYVGGLEDQGNWVKVITDDGAIGYAAKQYLYRH